MITSVSFLACLIPVAISNPCQSSPCMNGGKCFSNESSHICSCPVGLSGHRCEERTAISKFIYVFFPYCKSIELLLCQVWRRDEIVEHVVMIMKARLGDFPLPHYSLCFVIKVTR